MSPTIGVTAQPLAEQHSLEECRGTQPELNNNCRDTNHPQSRLEALQQLSSQQFLQSTIDSLSSHIVVLDESGKILLVNEAWKTFADEIQLPAPDHGLGHDYLAVYRGARGADSKTAEAACGIQAVLNATTAEYEQTFADHSPQEKRWFQMKVTRFAGPGPARAVVVHDNITARRRTEEALQESDFRVQMATEAAQMGTWEWNLTTDLGTWDERESQLIGLAGERSRTPASEFFDHVHPDDRDEMQQVIRRVIHENEPYNCEFRVVRNDGQIRWLAGKGEVVRDENGKPILMRGVNFDITNRKLTELELNRTKDELADFVENATVGLHWVGPDGKILWVNRSELNLLGYREDECVGRHIAEFHADREVIDDILNRLGRFEDLHNYEARLRCKDGTIIDVLIDSSVYQENGEFIHTRCFTRDVTTRKQAERALQELNESLEQQVLRRTDMLRLLQEVTRSANEAHSTSDALRAALKHIAQYNDWQFGHAWLRRDDGSRDMASSGVWFMSRQVNDAAERLGEFRKRCTQQRLSVHDGIIGPVMETGKPKWIDDVKQLDDWRRCGVEHLGVQAVIAFPVTVDGEVVAVLEFFTNQPAHREDRFMEIMPDIGIQLGHVIKRKQLERQIAEISSDEQQRIGRELHDTIAQHLTGAEMMLETVRHNLAEESSPSTGNVREIGKIMRNVQQHVRSLSRGLMPVGIDPSGLMNALESLARQTSEMYEVTCRYDCLNDVVVENSTIATHLYRIAQEAVHNAVKHGKANHIHIQLNDDEHVSLTIVDDGAGFPATTKERQHHSGNGLKIVRYRVDVIGGQLAIQSKDGQGTRVVCTLKPTQDKTS